jgi:ABC-type microcin C transport system permease subunit YejE
MKRAESEPSIPHLVESERTGLSPPWQWIWAFLTVIVLCVILY